MSDWSAGYVSDIGYTFGYYTELNPLRVQLAFLNAGLAFPQARTACELGFGQGLSVNIHAAASLTQWHGTDFNPAQAAFAEELATASGSGARLYDNAFADFTQREDLPEFDFIGLHGIWSWVSDENRAVLVDFVRRKLKVGGVLYVSYNTLPGWAAFAPMRHLMAQHAELIGVEGHGIVSRINGALDFSNKLLATNPAYARVNPQTAERLKKLEEQNRHYLAHEYFNRDWHPMHIATIAKWLEPAKVSYGCSAHYMDHIDAVSLSAEQQSFLNAIPDVMFRESTRDFMVNQQFRRDYWVKGSRRLSPLEQAEGWRAQRVVLTSARSDVPLKVAGVLGEATMSEAVYAPILDFLADNKPRSIAEIEQSVRTRAINLGQIRQAAMLLTGAGHLSCVQEEPVVEKARKRTDKLNRFVMDKARGSSELSHLASPVTGGGVAVGRFQQLFLLARSQGNKLPEDWAQYVWKGLAAQGQLLTKDGKTLATAAENLDELTRQAHAFAEKQLPILKALQVA